MPLRRRSPRSPRARSSIARRHNKAHATASLTPLSLLALTIVLVWAAAVLRDLFAAPHAPMAT
jgi:hypothetical protein